MINEYLTVLDDCRAEITEKKSRFIATIHHVESEDEAVSFITSVKKTCWDARHNCHAYVIGAEQPLERANDDGEPSRTAGLPILESIKVAGLTNVCIVVTRYFGGILLGAGPLARAYREAASLCIDNAARVRMRLLRKYLFTTDYDSYGKLRYETDRCNLKVTDTVFSDRVSLCLALSPEETAHITDFYRELTRGLQTPEDLGTVWVEEYI